MTEALPLFCVIDSEANETYVSVEEHGEETAFTVKEEDFLVKTQKEDVVVWSSGKELLRISQEKLFILDDVCRIMFGDKEVYSLQMDFSRLPPNCS